MNIIDAVMMNLDLAEIDPRGFASLVETRLHCLCGFPQSSSGRRFEGFAAALHDADMLFVRSDSAFSLAFDAGSDGLTVLLVISGGLDIAAQAEVACQRGDAFAISTRSRWRAAIRPGTRFCALSFRKADAARLTERLTGRPPAEPLALEARFRSASPLGRMLAALITAAVAGAAGDPLLARCPQTGELLQDGMLALLLENLPHNHVDGIMRHRTEALPWPVRRAIDHVAAHARLDIGVAEVAKAAGMSVRSLQQNFQRFLKTSPQDYIKTVRLEGVRRELRDPNSRRSIEDIASDWSFVNRGHFATLYRRTYGELPSQTRRSR